MYCPRCGTPNADTASTCVSCGQTLLFNAAAAPVQVKTSGLAIAAFVLGILSLFTCGLTAIPAIILGVFALMGISQGGGRLTGTAFAVIGIAVPSVSLLLVPLLLGILMPGLARTRQLAFRMTCGTNLSGIGKAMLLYSDDHQNQLPVAGGPDTAWGEVANWTAATRQDAFDLAADGTGGKATVSSCFYLLVKYMEASPKSFVCKGDAGTTEFRPFALDIGAMPLDFELAKGWDFGPARESWRHCSYAYHIPFGHRPLTVSNQSGFAIAADRNPFLNSPAGVGVVRTGFIPDVPGAGGNADTAKLGNALAHQLDGQNVLFLDTHVSFEKRSYCGIEDDNIYLISPDARGGTPLGLVPAPGPITLLNSKDSVLVHDPDRFGN